MANETAPYMQAFGWIASKHNGHTISMADADGKAVVACCDTCGVSRSFGDPQVVEDAFARLETPNGE